MPSQMGHVLIALISLAQAGEVCCGGKTGLMVEKAKPVIWVQVTSEIELIFLDSTTIITSSAAGCKIGIR
jgi:hypothetical protein